nr:killer cell immunoglobulin-like receptor 2DL4 [Vicugna pacos]
MLQAYGGQAGNLTSFGCSKSSLDVYHLFREGESHGCWLAAGHSHNGTCQAEFPLGPGSPAHSATYRCHGFSSHSPYRWSDPSDPLYLSVTGEAPSACPTPVLRLFKESHKTKLQHRPAMVCFLLDPHLPPGNLHVVVGPSAAILFLAILPFFLIRHWCSAKKSKSQKAGASAIWVLSRAISQRCPTSLQSPQVFAHPHSSCPFMQDPETEEPREVAYALWDHWTSTQKKVAPTSQRPTEPSTGTSVYADLAAH